jgi:hypothetical protein
MAEHRRGLACRQDALHPRPNRPVVSVIQALRLFFFAASKPREWVANHRAIEVDYFFVYDNESTDDGASILLSSPKRLTGYQPLCH